jgi:hypothetical protein
MYLRCLRIYLIGFTLGSLMLFLPKSQMIGYSLLGSKTNSTY